MKTFESVRLGQICGSVEGCSLGTSCSRETMVEMTLEAKIKAPRDPWDEWNRAFQVLVDEHIRKLEQINARFDALVQRKKTIADQVAAWGKVQPEPMRLGTIYRVDGAPNKTIDKVARQLGKLEKRSHNVACFLCGQHHFAIVCPLKPNLEGLAVAQARRTLKEQLTILAAGQALKGAEAEMLVNALIGGLSRFAEGHCEHVLQNGDEQGLRCEDATISGLTLATLVDSGVTHSFVSE
jgi:hypothetical protein